MKKEKEPSLFRQMITIHAEQSRRRKALRTLTKQSWSIDFLALLLIKAGRSLGDGVQLEVTNKDGMKVTLTYQQALGTDISQLDDSDNIFNKLDDDAAVQDFIRRNSRR